jgi:hypothetical protein
VSSEDVEIRKKGESEQAWAITKDTLVMKILTLSGEKNK